MNMLEVRSLSKTYGSGNTAVHALTNVSFAVVNIINSISMSVTARRRQCGMMRAIELPLHHWFFGKAITHYWGITWSLPIGGLAAIMTIVLGSAVLAAGMPIRRLSEQSVIVTLNEA